MSIPHNKKRNSGLMYEFLVRTISTAIIEGNEKLSSTAIKVLKRHFKPGSQLYKEQRLINALVNTTVSSQSVASSIIQEAKNAATACNVVELDKEKSKLIRKINHSIKSMGVYEQSVPDYKMYATAQTLLNEWRNPTSDRDISKIASYEDKLTQWLVENKESTLKESVLEDDLSPASRKTLVKIMTEKINEKYSKLMNENQRDLVRVYALSFSDDNTSAVTEKLNEISSRAIELIDNYVSSEDHDDFVSEKILKAKKKIQSESFDKIDDELISRFMIYEKLASEIKGNDYELSE